MKKKKNVKKKITKKEAPATKNTAQRTKKPQREKRENSPVAWLVIVVVSLLLLSCFVFKNSSGAVGRMLYDLFAGLLGFGAYLLPISMIVIVFFWGEINSNGCRGFKFGSAVLFVLFFSAMSHLYLNGGDDLWKSGITLSGGGVIGGAFAQFFVMIFGEVFARIITTAITVLVLSFFVGTTKIGVWEKLSEFLFPYQQTATQPSRRVPQSGGSYENQSKPVVPINFTQKTIETTISDPFAFGNEVYSYSASKSSDQPQQSAPRESNMSHNSYRPTNPNSHSPFGYNALNNLDQSGENRENLSVKSDTGSKNSGIFVANTNISQPETSSFDPEESFDSEDSGEQKKPRRLFFKLIKPKNDLKDDFHFEEGEHELSSYLPDIPQTVVTPTKTTKKNDSKPQKSGYRLPPSSLLNLQEVGDSVPMEEIRAMSDRLVSRLRSFNVDARVTGYSVGPAFTRYELTPGEGVKVRTILSLHDDISLGMETTGVRMAPIANRAAIGVEIPNKHITKVSLRSLIESDTFLNAKSKITVCVGKTVNNESVYMDIDDMPHVLIAGQTKSGKSVAINCMILSLLFRTSPDEVKLILIDPKRVELNVYGRLPHLIMPVIDDMRLAAAALQWAVDEMERRYDLLTSIDVRNRDEYRQKLPEYPDLEDFPQIVIVIDELADLMFQARDSVEDLINRIAAKARACGIHLLIGTQRPSVDVVTGLIKANIPTRIAFKVTSAVDSRTILDVMGAEKLIGKGDMLYQQSDGARVRVQGSYVDTSEVIRVINFIIDNNGEADFDPDLMRALNTEAEKFNKGKKSAGDTAFNESGDSDFDNLCKAIEFALENGKIATNNIQRSLHVGFNKAADIIDRMEELGFISGRNGSKPREILIGWDAYEKWRSNNQE